MRDKINEKKYGNEGSGARRRAGASFSGNERNHLYLNRGGSDYFEVSGISGIDDPADARSFAILDFDRDGWQDFVLANANAPLARLFQNRMAELETRSEGRHNEIVALRFVGGNQSAEPSETWSSRDAFGTVVRLDLGDLEIEREFRAGEGLAAQNSSTLIVGIGAHTVVPELTVRFPSGVEQSFSDVPGGSLVTVFEDASAGPEGAFLVESYRRQTAPATSELQPDEPATLKLAALEDRPANLRILTTMATWCAGCKLEQPQLQKLRAAFDSESVSLYGIPVDPEDSPAELRAYAAKDPPSYELLADLPNDQRAVVRDFVIDTLEVDALPATIVTDGQGRVLSLTFGTPSISEIRRLLSELGS